MTSEHRTNRQPELDATKNVMENFHVYDSQRIKKYNNLLMVKSNNNKTYVSLIRVTGDVYKVCTAVVKDV